MAAVRHPGSIAQTGLARNSPSIRHNTRSGMSSPPSEKRTPPFVFQPKALGGLSAGPLAGGQGRSRAAVARHAPALRACQRSGKLNAKPPLRSVGFRAFGEATAQIHRVSIVFSKNCRRGDFWRRRYILGISTPHPPCDGGRFILPSSKRG
jgi:hypothetical protein